MDICRQDKCCLDKYHSDSWHLLNMVLPLKFGQTGVSNSWDIPDMDKCRWDKCRLEKCHRDSWHLLKMVPVTYSLNSEGYSSPRLCLEPSKKFVVVGGGVLM